MTLADLKHTNPQVVENWLKDNMGGPNEEHGNFDSCSVQASNGELFLVWNNGCYMEAFIWSGTEWNDLNKEFLDLEDRFDALGIKFGPGSLPWYDAGCKELEVRGLN